MNGGKKNVEISGKYAMETVISKRSVQRPLHIFRKSFGDLADDLEIFGKYAMTLQRSIAQSI
jgi:hypothetical protein